MLGWTNVGRANVCRTKLAAPLRSANPKRIQGNKGAVREREECIPNLRTVCVCLFKAQKQIKKNDFANFVKCSNILVM